MKKIISLLSLLMIVVMLLTSCADVIDFFFAPDYREVTNGIFEKYIEMNLIVETGSVVSSKERTSQGSGVIYAKDTHFYYCLTNAHVVETAANAKNITYTITDCYGVVHKATLVHSDTSRDLAVLKFISADPLCIVELAKFDPFVGQNIAVISTSNHLINSVTYGKVKSYDTVKVTDSKGNDDTRVTFPVIWHDAPMWEGGSGSVLLNMDMELVGINYAVSTNSQGQFYYGFAVSVSRVREYLEENNLMK